MSANRWPGSRRRWGLAAAVEDHHLEVGNNDRGHRDLAELLRRVVLNLQNQCDTTRDASLSTALDRVRGWAASLGITSASAAAQEIKNAVPDIGRTMLVGVARGISGLTSLLVFLGFTAFATFFLVKDAPAIGRWIERHMGMDPAEARIVLGDIIQALRRYFLGLTIIAALTTSRGRDRLADRRSAAARHDRDRHLLSSYIPIVGAWTAGIFVFALALANQGTTAALVMAAIVLRPRRSSKQTSDSATTARFRPERKHGARGWNGDKAGSRSDFEPTPRRCPPGLADARSRSQLPAQRRRFRRRG